MSEMDAPPKMEQFWDTSEHNLGHGGGSIISSSGSTGSGGSGHQYERNLNFATGAIEENEYGFPKKKTVRDPLSHRIIEKRRRDRMNNCLADLARLLPPSSLRKGRGRIEKTEIVELAIKHLRHLQCHPCTSGDKCEFNYIMKGARESNPDPDVGNYAVEAPTPTLLTVRPLPSFPSSPEEHFRLGYHECMSETLHFLVEQEGNYPGDSVCVRIIKHLRNHSENLMREQFKKDEGKLEFLEIKKEDTDRKLCGEGGSSSSSGYQGNGSGSSPGSDGNGGQDAESPELFSIPVIAQHSSPIPPPISMDYEGENSCCSTQLSLDISEMTGSEPTTGRGSSKPPIPVIIGSGSSTTPSSSVTSPSGSGSLVVAISNCTGNGLSSSGDEDQCQGGDGGPSSSAQYKFKNNIKQRFVTDPENIPKPHPHLVTKASLKQAPDPEGDTDPTKCGQSGVTHLRDEENMAGLPKCTDRRDSTSSQSSRTISIRQLGDVCDSKVKLGESSSPELPEQGPRLSPMEYQDSEMDVKLLSEDGLPKSNPLLVSNKQILGKNLGESNSSSLLCINSTDRVPAFALHDKGLYYIPLTIEKSVLTPYLAKIEKQSNLPPPPLHPVTISVCFLLSPKVGEKGRTLFKPNLDPTSSSLVPLPLNNDLLPEMPLPLITTRPIPLPLQVSPAVLNLKTQKSSPVKELASKFLLNRYSSKSRQYSPGPYRYPITTNLGGSHNHHHAYNGVSHGHNLSQSYYPGYYSTDSSSTSSSGVGLIPPSHFMAGEYSSSSSSSNSNSSSGNRGLVCGTGRSSSRKRTMSNLSGGSGSGSGSSSLGYHSYHEKYSPPSSQDSFPTGSSNSFPSQNPGYNNHSGSGSSSSHSYGGYHHSIGTRQSEVGPQIHHNMQFGYGMNLNPHLLPFGRDDKHELDRQRRSCSPSKNKRVKMGGRIHSGSAVVDNILKQKSLPVGLPIIPVPSME